MSVDPASEIESAVQAALPATVAGSTVAARRLDDDTWTVALTHEASNGLVFEIRHVDAAKAVAVVIEGLETNNEVERIARAPKLEHPETIAGVRAIVQAFGWSRSEVGAVVGLLEEVQALDAEEGAWLKSSFGEDRPPPRATGIM